MKVTWEHKDIRGGRRIKHVNGEEFIVSIRVDQGGKLSITSLLDGAVVCHDRDVVEWLNERGDMLPAELEQ